MIIGLQYLSFRQRFELLGLIVVLSITLTFAFKEPRTELRQVQDAGVLTVVTRVAPTAYYIGPDGGAGPEHDLARAFADWLGVRMEVVLADNPRQAAELLRAGTGQLAAIGSAAADIPPQGLAYGPPYYEVVPQLVYRSGRESARSVADLPGRRVEVVSGSSHAAQLDGLRRQYDGLEWTEHEELDGVSLLHLVSEGLIDYTVADSHLVTLTRRYYPELRVGFDLGGSRPVAWLFAADGDDSLRAAAERFFAEVEENGLLAQIIDRYYGHATRLDYVGSRVFLRHVGERLPRYRALFEGAAAEYDLDWRLLAAVSYQESHWDPRARSPTGVRGLMMLTLRTASDLGVENRLDPEQAIYGGAAYITRLQRKVPDRITEPDRTWLALAAYNVGFGHLEDARRITEAQGYDPDRWLNVKRHLPLLTQKKWYSTTRYGYARGNEPVQYVQNIRNYYDLLVWHTEHRQGRPPGPEPSVPAARAPKAL